MLNILQMNNGDIRALNPNEVKNLLTPDEVIHIAKTLGAFWGYDYEAAKAGRVGMHALLKSGQHSDGFFFSKVLLEPENIRRIFAHQMAARLIRLGILNKETPNFIIGIPDGATALGKDVARILHTQNVTMLKINGKITLFENTPILDQSVLLVEDFCTRATGFMEAVTEIRNKAPLAKILPYNPVIINRGGMKNFIADGQQFTIVPIVEKRILDWNPEDCPLCATGSTPIKPKATDENWQALITSQL